MTTAYDRRSCRIIFLLCLLLILLFCSAGPVARAQDEAGPEVSSPVTNIRTTPAAEAGNEVSPATGETLSAEPAEATSEQVPTAESAPPPPTDSAGPNQVTPAVESTAITSPAAEPAQPEPTSAPEGAIVRETRIEDGTAGQAASDLSQIQKAVPHFSPTSGLAPDEAMVSLLNGYNFANLFSEILGNRYVSHGCFHLSPACIYILYNILPKGCVIKTEPYNIAYDKSRLTDVPYLVSLVSSEDDLAKLKKKLANARDVSIVALPASDKWLLYYKKELFAQFDISAGPAQPVLNYLGRNDDGRPEYDDLTASPTRSGTYRISYFGDYFFAPDYRDTTIIPQGAYIRSVGGAWKFEKNNKLWDCPTVVQEDLDKVSAQKPYNYYYYDIVRDSSGRLVECKWSAHDFGKYVIGWVDESKVMANEVAHTNGVLIKEQLDLVKDLANLLVLSAKFKEEDFDTLIFRNQRFATFQRYAAFLEAPDRFKSNPDLVLYKLSRNWLIYPDEESMIDPGIKTALKVLDIYEAGNFDLSPVENNSLINIGACDYLNDQFVYNIKRINGIRYYLKKYRVAVDKFAYWYDTLKANWDSFLPLAEVAGTYFQVRGIDNSELQQKILYQLIVRRTNFQKIDAAALLAVEKEELEKIASGLTYE